MAVTRITRRLVAGCQNKANAKRIAAVRGKCYGDLGIRHLNHAIAIGEFKRPAFCPICGVGVTGVDQNGGLGFERFDIQRFRVRPCGQVFALRDFVTSHYPIVEK